MTLECGGEVFFAHGSIVTKPGFTTLMPWKAGEGQYLPAFTPGEAVGFKEVELYQAGIRAVIPIVGRAAG